MYTHPLTIATFLSTIFFALGTPAESIYIYSNLTQTALAVNDIILCFGTVLAVNIWSRHAKSLYPYWGVLAILEIVITAIILIYLAITKDVIAYFLAHSVCRSLITRNMACGGNRLRSLLFTSKEREDYDNIHMVVMATATIIGGAINMVVTIPVWVAFTSLFIGESIDNVLYYKVWKKTLPLNK